MFLLFENIAVGLTLLFLCTDGFGFLFRRPVDAAPEGGDVAEIAIQCLIYGLVCVCIHRYWKRVCDASTSIKLVMALPFLALLSTVWSEFPAATFRRSLILLATTLFGIYFGTRFQLRRQVAFLAIVLGITAVMSLFCVVLLPSFGITADGLHDGDWQGIFDTKNGLARAMALSCVVFMMLPGENRVLRSFGLLASAALVFAAGSVTGITVAATLIVAYLALRATRRGMTLPALVGLTIVLTCLCVICWVGLDVQTVSAVVGRDATLTGRDELWAAVLAAISRRPWLGDGYSAVWWQAHSAVGAFIVQQVGWATPHSHNGLLDLTLDLGVVGAILFLAGYFKYIGKGIAASRLVGSKEELWPLLYLLFLFCYNLDESSLLRINAIFWVLYVSAAVSLSLRPRSIPGKSGIAVISAVDEVELSPSAISKR
ncbi:MAG: O-antigen ligase family protein [Bryobacteraceae bacterium]|jgi:O-antigen ligase